MRTLTVTGILIAAVMTLAGVVPARLYPDYYPEPVYAVDELSNDKFELGRQLFYDPILSRDSSTSCASCHSPFNSFAHTDHKLSHGIYDSIGKRNAPALINLAWQKQFMWDGAVNHIEVQPLAPIENHIEMDEKMAHVVMKLQRTKKYPGLFFKAFGDSVITGQFVLKALAQFQLELISCDSRYDSVMQGLVKFTEQERSGYTLFKANCAACHPEPMFTNYGYASNGLSVDPWLHDYGRVNITWNPKDSFLFKVPTLRNVEYTYPYMHDGRFAKLYDVVNYYSGGIPAATYTSPEMKKPIVLSADEKIDLVAFLLTLSDKRFIFNPRFGPPAR